jgi:hypothetical protein
MKHTLEYREEVFRPLILSIVIETEEELKEVCSALHMLPHKDKYDNMVHDLEEELEKLPN